MTDNKECPSHFGVYRTERLLKLVFDDVEVMPYGHKGYDFVCNKGMKVDSKSSCLRKDGNWTFHIRYNTITDYFCCIAWDNRDDLNPLYMWMLPSDEFGHLSTASISPSTIHKWDKYLKPIGKLSACCNDMRWTQEDEQ